MGIVEPLDYEPRRKNKDKLPFPLRQVIALIVMILIVFGFYLWFSIAREMAADRTYRQWQLSTRPTQPTTGISVTGRAKTAHGGGATNRPSGLTP
jgi:hypothetical protein